MISYVTAYYGDPGTTVKHTCGDSAEDITDTTATLSSGSRQASTCLITVEDNDIRMAFGTDPTTSLGHKFVAGTSLRLTGPEIKQMKFINETALSNAVLMITPYFE